MRKPGQRMMEVARRLSAKFGAKEQACILTGAAAALVVGDLGSDLAAEFFRDLADAIEYDGANVPNA